MDSDLKKDLADLKESIDQVKDIRAMFDPLDRPALGASNSASNININAGGMGVWLACSMCACMFVMNLGLLAMIVNHDRKIDDLADYLHAIYMVAPSLKPEKSK